MKIVLISQKFDINSATIDAILDKFNDASIRLEIFSLEEVISRSFIQKFANYLNQLILKPIIAFEKKIASKKFSGYFIAPSKKHKKCIIKFDPISINKLSSIECPIDNVDAIINISGLPLSADLINKTSLGEFRLIKNSIENSFFMKNCGLYEFFHSEKNLTFKIHHLSSKNNIPTCLFEGILPSEEQWIRNNIRLKLKVTGLISYILSNNLLKKDLVSRNSHHKTIIDTNSSPIKIIIKLYKTIFLYYFRKIKNRGREIHWDVFYSNQSIHPFKYKNFKKLNNPSNCFLADPFISLFNSRKIIFHEEFDYKERKGKISATEIIGDKQNYLGTILEEPFHLSFPFLFEENNEIYMIPESYGSREIRLYRNIEYPTKWKLERILLQDVSAVDSMIIKHKGLYFLLTTLDTSDTEELSSELHVFYSKDLLKGNWIHINSGLPIFIDGTKGRNGGILYTKEKLYRVAQVQEGIHYGKNIEIFAIEEINSSLYEEKISNFKHLKALNTKYDSHHHLNICGKYLVTDFGKVR